MSNIQKFKSKKEVTEFLATKDIDTSNWSELKWLSLNKGHAEIHIMKLAESMYDQFNESKSKLLEEGQWHIPFENKISSDVNLYPESIELWGKDLSLNKVKISVAMGARTSYTVVGDEVKIDFQKMIDLHDRLLSQTPPHSSPLEHCAKTMNEPQYRSSSSSGFSRRGGIIQKDYGWCNNFKGFIPYRYLIDNNYV